jgi:uncharacterized membrane protein (GlpM family)
MTVEAGRVHVEAHPSKIRETKWHEYALRFVFGGVITAVVGIIGKAFGPAVAGLFLAFPAILPASLTLVARHEGERAAALDALGAALGSIGLVAFGGMIWLLASQSAGWLAILVASVAWLVVSIALWLLYGEYRHRFLAG